LTLSFRTYAGVVDEDVKTIEVLLYLFGGGFDGGVVGGVDLDEGNSALDAGLGLYFFEYLFALGEVARANDDVVVW